MADVPGPARPAQVLGENGLMDRDRDTQGRARSARPRDELGRPLPYGAPGVAREEEGHRRSADETLDTAQRLLDAGRPFHAHEVFEDAWKADRTADDADLWKALAQLAVGYTHQLRGNPVGAARLLTRAADALARYTSTAPHGIDITTLRTWAAHPGQQSPPPLRRPHT